MTALRDPYWCNEEHGLWLYQGDAATVLSELPDSFVQTCVTSPPYYGLRSYLPDKVKLRDDAPEWVKKELEERGIEPE